MENELIFNPTIFDILNSSYDLSTFSKSILILGKDGSGKTLLSSLLAKKLNLELIDITEFLTDEYLDNLYRSSIIKLYRIDLRKLTDKKQNILLKIFEEPPANVFLILIANNKQQVLNTIYNRAKVINIARYTKEELSKLAINYNLDIDRYLGNIIQTPGEIDKIIKYNIDLDNIENLCNKIINKLSEASFSNTLSIIDKLNFNDEYDKIDIGLFLKTLYTLMVEFFVTTYSERHALLLDVIQKTLVDIAVQDSKLNKRFKLTSMLTDMWLIMH